MTVKRRLYRLGLGAALVIAATALFAAPANASDTVVATNQTYQSSMNSRYIDGDGVTHLTTTAPGQGDCTSSSDPNFAFCRWDVVSLNQTGCAGSTGICGTEKHFRQNANAANHYCWTAVAGSGAEWPMKLAACSDTNSYQAWIVRYENAPHTIIAFANVATGRCLATSSGHGIVTEACSTSNGYQDWF